MHAHHQEHGADQAGHDQPDHQVVFTLALRSDIVIELHRPLLVRIQGGRETRAALTDEVVVELGVAGRVACLKQVGGLLQDLVQRLGGFEELGLGRRILSLQIGQLGILVEVFQAALISHLCALQRRIDHRLVTLFHQGRIHAPVRSTRAGGVLVCIVDQQGALGDLMDIFRGVVGPAKGKDTDPGAYHDHA
ncbi:conserved hypothetical protein [Ricinus communis]|uniref:Uncharacterized protein n=1 Tax=Ricinus communis TaxID=3988 RepID=B9TG23_RICCO|nr:conserved hypothetical protein [Ricinus communis]